MIYESKFVEQSVLWTNLFSKADVQFKDTLSLAVNRIFAIY